MIIDMYGNMCFKGCRDRMSTNNAVKALRRKGITTGTIEVIIIFLFCKLLKNKFLGKNNVNYLQKNTKIQTMNQPFLLYQPVQLS